MNTSTLHEGPQDFRDYLRQEFLRRFQNNPRYSLRSFAKFLRVSHSTLSEVFSSRRPLTEKMIERLSDRLGISPQERKPFLATEKEGETYFPLDMDMFTIISDWHHQALLELFSLDQFRPDPKWMAKALNIPTIEVEMALERLVRVGLLECRQGKWSRIKNSSTTLGHPKSAMALRKMQKQILSKAMAAVDETAIEKRDQTSMIFSMDPELMPEAKKRITEFRRELTRYLEKKSKRKKEVTILTLSLFPITETEIATSQLSH